MIVLPIIQPFLKFVQCREGTFMHRFSVCFHSVQDVQDFVTLAAAKQFSVTVGNDSYRVNGTSFMGIFTLDCSRPLTVMTECSQTELDTFLQEAKRFLVA